MTEILGVYLNPFNTIALLARDLLKRILYYLAIKMAHKEQLHDYDSYKLWQHLCSLKRRSQTVRIWEHADTT